MTYIYILAYGYVHSLVKKKCSGENGHVKKKGRSGSPKNYSRSNASECHVNKKQEKNPAKT